MFARPSAVVPTLSPVCVMRSRRLTLAGGVSFDLPTHEAKASPMSVRACIALGVLLGLGVYVASLALGVL